MRAKTPASALTDNFVDALGKLYPTTLMNWDTKFNGKAVPWTYVKQAMSALDRGDIQTARVCLMRPITNGLVGGPDITGVIGHAPGATVAPGTLCGWEVKAGNDQQRDDQIICERNLKRHGAIYILVESVEQGIGDTKKFAGPGEK